MLCRICYKTKEYGITTCVSCMFSCCLSCSNDDYMLRTSPNDSQVIPFWTCSRECLIILILYRSSRDIYTLYVDSEVNILNKIAKRIIKKKNYVIEQLNSFLYKDVLNIIVEYCNFVIPTIGIPNTHVLRFLEKR